MEGFICGYCNKSFSNKSNLTTHQKRTKKCLELQNKSLENLFYCDSCKKQYSSKQNFDKHSCKKTEDDKLILKLLEEKDKEIVYLKEQLAIANEKLAQLAEIGMKKHTTVKTTYKINQNIMNKMTPFNLTPETVKDIFQKNFTYKHLINGKEGITEFTMEFILTENGKYKLICTDSSRRIFMYIDNDNNVYRDKDATYFMDNMFIPALIEKSNEIVKEKLTPELDDAIRDLLLKIRLSVVGELKNDKSILTSTFAKKLTVNIEN
jgi:hypothetical protein